MRIMVCDRSSHRITRREYTDEGFMRVPGRVARTGIQEYLASELGLKGNGIIRVYRAPEEVFSADSLAGYNGADITLHHPKGLVTADNYKATSVGVVRGGGTQDDDFVQCDLIVKDAAAIKAINSGKCELSAGYTAIYDHAPGVTPEGEPYDYVQREIKINHVAIVDRARAGAHARIFDNDPTGGNKMPVLITTDSGRSVDVADPANAQVVADAFDRLLARATGAEKKAETAQATADGAAEKLAAALALTSDSAIQLRVAELHRVTAVARKIVGDSFKCDSCDSIEIMRAAMAAKRPAIAWGDKSADYVQCAFEIADADTPAETDEEKTARLAKESKDSGDIVNQLKLLSKDGAAPVVATPTTDSAPVLSRGQAALNARIGKKGK